MGSYGDIEVSTIIRRWASAAAGQYTWEKKASVMKYRVDCEGL